MTEITNVYDVVIIGTGISGAIIAKQLGSRGYSVLLLEAGVSIPNGREAMVEKFFLDTRKLPESPFEANEYAPSAQVRHLIDNNFQDANRTYLDQAGPIPFGSTYERRAGGTMWHWMGTSLRFLPNDFQLRTKYGHGVDWPINYQQLAHDEHESKSYYDLAEDEIGVSASVADQDPQGKLKLFREGRDYPMPAIPLSTVDHFFKEGVRDLEFEGLPVWHYATPAGRNSRPYKNRRACAGNTNCVPLCPIQAKYDPTVTLHAAFNYHRVSAIFQAVATRLLFDTDKKRITGVEFRRYDRSQDRAPAPPETVQGRIVVLAANGIESPKLLLHSGIRNKHIGRYLMDHPFYLRWGLTPEPIYPYRGPLSTGGLDGLRDGEFRKSRAAFRIEIGNDGWRLPTGDPTSTVLDLIEANQHGPSLVKALNATFIRQCRIGFELEQLPNWNNRVELSSHVDRLGIPRPRVHFSMSEYESESLAAASRLCDLLFKRLHIDDKSQNFGSPSFVMHGDSRFEFMGAGHIMGTCRMGKTAADSVVDREQRSHDFRNLFVVGSSVFPTGGTANPTLTIAALAFWAADTITRDLHA